MRRWWWEWLVSVMTGGRCHRQKKMMGRGADGGCGTEERPCRPGPRVPVKTPATQLDNSKKPVELEICFFSQARKALCERSPFDVPEDGSSSSLGIPTLPSGLANLLKQSDSRKRHKKSSSGSGKKSSRQSERSRAGGIWVETEEYFRDLALSDIDGLSDLCSFSSLADRKCFSIPCVGNEPRENGNVNVHGSFRESQNLGNANGAGVNDEVKDVVVKEEMKDVVKEEMKEDFEQCMEIDSRGADSLQIEEKICSTSNSSASLEWLLGSRNRILLSSERPSKKRKLLGTEVGLEKVLVACPCQGSSSLCHFCCSGDTGNESNQLIVCSSCKVVVHQKCYGVQVEVDEKWLCSWCKQKNDSNNFGRPCVLCPKQGGALKPVYKSVQNNGPVEFAHLFCSQWMPEIYVDDLTKMEPIMNMGEIKEIRRKLVCNICKVKCGACIPCSHGTCRITFHPICAREARQRMEVCGKHGCDTVELRAFCSKHSDIQDGSSLPQSRDGCMAVGNDLSVRDHLPLPLSMSKSRKIKVGHKNGDKISLETEAPDTSSDISGNSDLQEIALSDAKINAGSESDFSEAHQSSNMGMLERNNGEDVHPSNSLNFPLILKKLIDRGKVNVKDVASEIGISPDSLSGALADGGLVPDLQFKIFKWLRNHAYMGTLQKGLQVKAKSGSSVAETGAVELSDGAIVSESDMSDPVAVKSVPPRRRTKGNIRILRDNKTIYSDEIFGKGVTEDEVKADHLIKEEQENPIKMSTSDGTEKNSMGPVDLQRFSENFSSNSRGSPAKPSNCRLSEGSELEEAAISEQNTSLYPHLEIPICLDVNSVVPDLTKGGSSGFYVHPYICKELLQLRSGFFMNNRPLFKDRKGTKHEFEGCRKAETSHVDASSDASVCCDHRNQYSNWSDGTCKPDEGSPDQLVKARKLGVLELSPEDELEGEIIYFQRRLLGNAFARKQLAGNLVCKVARSLPLEIDLQRQQRWDAVLVTQYHYELREAKKQGRKERKHKEAQAVLAAATAAAAASSRISSLRKDASEEPANQENLLKTNTSSGRVGISTQLMPRAKETLTRMAVSRVSLEKQTDYVQTESDFSRDHPRSCDICRRSETILNPILVCSSCKVAVHLDCYRRVKESTGPWYCELCEDLLSSRSSGAPSINFWEKPYFVAECGLCGGTTGAFRKSADGQWVHAFCAEWVFESTFKRGQVNPVQGMETVVKGMDICCICRHKHGTCIKCNYGHCQTTFHPSCARSAGFYMTGGGKLQHKAYCEKHSLEQRVKAETQKHGVEELKSLKQIRVELERLRLLCERIIKREKIKRDLVLCSHEILGVRRDHVARSVLVQSPFFRPDISSESATTSLKGNTDGCKSCSEAIQRSDDVTVDSTLCVKHQVKAMSMDIDQKTDDSYTSQNHVTRKPTDRILFSGKQIPHRHSFAARNLLEDGEWSSRSRKQIETFEKELVMTSDEASVKNQRLPKGYVYIPVDRLQEEKQINQDASSGEPSEHDQ